MNESKTKFMAINGSPMDKVSFMMGNHCVRHCEDYMYLGVPITCDGSNISTVKLHLENKNKEFPFMASSCRMTSIALRKIGIGQN